MSLGNYKILNPSRTFRLGLIFFSSLFTAFHLTNLEKKLEMDGHEKKALIIKTVPTFRYPLLCFCIVFVEHLGSLNGMRSQQSSKCLKHDLLQHQSSVSQDHKWLELKHTRERNLYDIFIPEHKVLWAADACFSTQGMANICQLLSIRSVAPVLASLAPLCPSEITVGSTVNCPNH